MKIKIFPTICVLAIWLTSASLSAAQEPPSKLSNAQCFECHAGNDPVIDQSKFETSVHQSLECVDCHRDIIEIPHTDALQKVDCAGCHQEETQRFAASDHARAMGPKAGCGACHGDVHAAVTAQDTGSPVHRHNIPATCSGCHQTQNQQLAAMGQSYLQSVHGLSFQKGSDTKAAVCSDCHGSHAVNKPSRDSSKLFWKNIPATCGQCHQTELKDYAQSVHGLALASGNRDIPVCTDCHGEHGNDAIKNMSSRVAPAHIPQTCGQCHSAERINIKYSLFGGVLTSYMQSYHGLAVRQGSMTAANCASCHGAHNILPSSDPRSMIYPENLTATCGRCHPGISAKVSEGSIHKNYAPGGNPVNDWVRNFYIILIVGVSGLLLLHNLLDFRLKAAAHYRRSLIKGSVNALNPDERRQHLLLILTFTLLAYTGFALKFPQTWWSWMFWAHDDWLRWGHRGTAAVFCLLSVYHVYYVLFTTNGRKHLSLLLINRNDFVQFGQTFLYYFGRRDSKPKTGFYSYVQKLEYWALVWGSVIMVITGGLMFSEVWFLKEFPKWLYDVVRSIHAYEAVLACVTIVIWHGYFVTFDPEVYPGNWAWLHGQRPSPPDTDEPKRP